MLIPDFITSVTRFWDTWCSNLQPTSSYTFPFIWVMFSVLLLPMGTVPGSKHNRVPIILISKSVAGLLLAKCSKRKYHLPLIIHLLHNTSMCLLSHFEKEHSTNKIQIYKFWTLYLGRVISVGKITRPGTLSFIKLETVVLEWPITEGRNPQYWGSQTSRICRIVTKSN
jgi:hypothetical protein